MFKRGPEGQGYYTDRGHCTLELAPLLAADTPIPALHLQLFTLLGLGSPAAPPVGTSPSSHPNRTRGGRNSKKRREARRTCPHGKTITQPDPFVAADARRADDSHKSEHLLACGNLRRCFASIYSSFLLFFAFLDAFFNLFPPFLCHQS